MCTHERKSNDMECDHNFVVDPCSHHNHLCHLKEHPRGARMNRKGMTQETLARLVLVTIVAVIFVFYGDTIMQFIAGQDDDLLCSLSVQKIAAEKPLLAG